MRFKERGTDLLFDAQLVGEGLVIVRQAPPYESNMEQLTIEDFIERFDESYVQPS